MMVTLRLYRQHDLDLISLYRHPNFSLPAAIKKSLIAYVNEQQLIIKNPLPYLVTDDKISKIIQMHIFLDDEKDISVINWLKTTKKGYRNSILKNIVRGYLSAPAIYAYKTEKEAVDVASRNNDIFEKNIKECQTIKEKQNIKKSRKKKTEEEMVDEIINDDLKKKNSNTFIEDINEEEELKEAMKKTTNNTDEQPEQVEKEEDMFGMFDNLMNSI